MKAPHEYYSTDQMSSLALHQFHMNQMREVSGLVANGMSRRDAADLVGMDPADLGELIEPAPYFPTPAMIAAECAKLQQDWSASRLTSRHGEQAEQWEVPHWQMTDLRSSLAAAG